MKIPVTNPKKELLRFITKEMRGIEIGSWFNPYAPKQEGYNSVVLDIYDRDRLIEIANTDTKIPRANISNIEPVDVVGSATEIASLFHDQSGTFDYILSSHNFEHIPDPVRFLQGCGNVLKPHGILSMIIPDKRLCFDYFRPLSTTSDVLSAFFECRKQPTPAQVFDFQISFADFLTGGKTLWDNPHRLTLSQDISEAFAAWNESLADPGLPCRGAHCWVMTPASFELLMSDLHFLGLSPFTVREISPGISTQFYAHLQNTGIAPPRDSSDTAKFYAHRRKLLFRIVDELAIAPPASFRFPRSGWGKAKLMASVRALRGFIRGS